MLGPFDRGFRLLFVFQSFSELFVSFLESESEVPRSSSDASVRVSNPLLSGMTPQQSTASHVPGGLPIATSTPIGTPARNNLTPLPPSAMTRPLTASAPSDGMVRWVIHKCYQYHKWIFSQALFFLHTLDYTREFPVYFKQQTSLKALWSIEPSVRMKAMNDDSLWYCSNTNYFFSQPLFDLLFIFCLPELIRQAWMETLCWWDHLLKNCQLSAALAHYGPYLKDGHSRVAF